MKNLIIITILLVNSLFSMVQTFSPTLREVSTPWEEKGVKTTVPGFFFDLSNNLELHIVKNNNEIELHKLIHFAF